MDLIDLLLAGSVVFTAAILRGYSGFGFSIILMAGLIFWLPASQIVPIDGDLPADSASLLACGVITGVGAVVNTAQVEPGSTVFLEVTTLPTTTTASTTTTTTAPERGRTTTTRPDD